MALHLHRGVEVAELARGLARLLADPLPDPLATELVVVPAKGIERWLTQRLSHHLGTTTGTRLGSDGVCAGVHFVSPSSLIGLLTGRRSTSWAATNDDPYGVERLTWAVLDVIDRHLDEWWLAPVAQHLGHGGTDVEAELRQGRRYALARHLAGLFTEYTRQRPDLTAAWRRGDLAGIEGDLAWQQQLWRLVTEDIARRNAADEVAASPAHLPDDLRPHTPPDVRHAAVLTALRSTPDLLDLPARLSMFGHTRLPATEIDLLEALAEHRDVHLWLPQASPVAWDRLAPAVADGPVRRAEDTTAHLVRHPLLASLGRDSRELQRALAGRGIVDRGAAAPPEEGTTLLSWLQHDLALDRPADATVRAGRVLNSGDSSIAVHACHGPARQVDVVRDVITGLLQDDPTLEPRDILVMCPDIEAYAPLFSAAFGLGEEIAEFAHPAHGFRVRLADRALTSTNPLLGVPLALLDLAGGRVTVSQVLDLAAHPAVAHRFRFDDDALDTIRTWIEESGIRWGLDAEHRAQYRMASFDQNTWRAGLDRLLLGVAMAEGIDENEATGVVDRGHLGPVLPVDDVGSGDIDLVGRFVEFTDRMQHVLDALDHATGVREWMAVLRHGTRSLTCVPRDDAWQSAQLQRELEQIAASSGHDTHLRLADVRRLLERRLAGRPGRANFRTGTLTVCTMVPMRSVPHRVVALVGLDDGVFPRAESIDGDDVLARDPHTGERDRRSEDRQLLLDAVMAAGEHLVITYSGASDLDGSERPPSVPIGELVDAVNGLADGVVDAGGGSRIVHTHPLQPFDPRLMRAGSPRTFDRAAFSGAQAMQRDRIPREPFLDAPLPPTSAHEDVALEDLRSFFANPARAFLRERLDIAPLREEETDLDAMPVELDGLGRWAVGDRILHDALAGVHPFDARQAEAARGFVPPGRLGERTIDEVVQVVGALMQAAGPLRGAAPRAVDVTVPLPDGRRLSGTVTGIHGDAALAVSYSSLSAKARLRAWIDLLALTVAHPEVPWTSHVVARNRGGAVHRTWGPLPPTAAAEWLAALVDIRDRGLCEPVPVPPKTTLAYAEAADRRRAVDADDPFEGRDMASPLDAARLAWETPRKPGAFPGEHDDPAYTQIYGHRAGMECLLAGAAPDETWNGEPSRLGRYALRIWAPEITHGRRA